ncbi:hypothetical protein A3C39_04950 [Candidatus Saccharibacteria bacterium RIFCSPHIGHO2_02_FULL_46_12]|nr:MAG: hypothetical protein A3C39_04950 [Candidatus Saccharibacteria bacterium RIFCSPHIGHO2_02_FULL_46_12]OGL31837.1 MAG: hypothetical protein A3E76_03290 [Candidatus Saccharibacteria bacterium RIFCSPHIGHO2_12_FULL_44_22]
MNNPSLGHSPEKNLLNAPSSIERAFAIDIIESELRNKQRDMWLNVDSNDLPAVAKYHNDAEELSEQYIVEAGVSKDDDAYPSMFDTARKYSWDTMSDEEWRIGFKNPEAPDELRVPGHAKLQIEQERLFGKTMTYDGTTYVGSHSIESHNDESEPTKSLEELQSDIETLREDVNGAFAKRMKVGFFARKKKQAFQEQLDEKKNQLDELTKERNNALVDQLRSEGLNEEQIVEKLAEQSNAELKIQNDGQRKAMLDGNFIQRKINSGFDKYANANTKTKIAFGALTALALVPAGFAVGAAAGVAGVAGAGGLLAARTYKTYQLNKAKLYATNDSIAPIEFKDNDTYRSVDEVLTDANTYSSKAIDDRIEKGDKVKKRAVIVTLGSLALVGGGAIAEHSDAISAAAQTVGNKIGNGFGSVKESIGGLKEHFTGSGSQSVETLPPSNDVQPPAIVPETPSNVPETPIDAAPPTQQPEVTAPAPEAQLPPAGSDGGGSIDGFNINQYADAMNVAHGEGWYSTFGELGITSQADQAKLLNNDVLMAKLSNMNLAYVDNRIGGWGIRMPADGKMPADALKLIRETAQQSNLTLSR